LRDSDGKRTDYSHVILAPDRSIERFLVVIEPRGDVTFHLQVVEPGEVRVARRR